MVLKKTLTQILAGVVICASSCGPKIGTLKQFDGTLGDLNVVLYSPDTKSECVKLKVIDGLQSYVFLDKHPYGTVDYFELRDGELTSVFKAPPKDIVGEIMLDRASQKYQSILSDIKSKLGHDLSFTYTQK
jgi:hypothetical protein